MNKHAEHGFLLSVSDFAATVGVARSCLIYYDRNGIFCPALRLPAGQQADNRFYTIDQIYDFQMLNFYRDAGCSLPEASRLCTSASDNDAPLQKQLYSLRLQQDHIRRMREALASMLVLKRLLRNSTAEQPRHIFLKHPLACRYFPFDSTCIRGTQAFAQRFSHTLEEIRANRQLLPLPAALTYSARLTPDGHFPVLGMLALVRANRPAHTGNYTLAAGHYLIIRSSHPLGGFHKSHTALRGYLIANDLIRKTPLFSWNTGIETRAGQNYYTECTICGVQPGKTAPGALPILPGLE